MGDADLIVSTAAASSSNVEVEAARSRGIPVMKRAELLGAITARGHMLAVAGTHGKTTTSAMAGHLIRSVGADATIFTGGFVLTPQGVTGPCMPGLSDDWVVEADEYDRSFLQLHPSISLVTSLDYDHPDCYADLDEMIDAYLTFLGQTSGSAIICGGHSPSMATLGRRSSILTQFYGIEGACLDWYAGDVEADPAMMRFTLLRRGEPSGVFELRTPGRHNVENAVGAIAAAVEMTGQEPQAFAPALQTFMGTERRLQTIASVDGVLVVDDYAHHPEEIRASLGALRLPGRRLRVIFQPHTYSRTAALLDELASALGLADEAIVLDIYAAREMPIPGISGKLLAETASRQGAVARYAASKEQAVEEAARGARPGDVVVTMGAGDVGRLGEHVVERLREVVPVGR